MNFFAAVFVFFALIFTILLFWDTHVQWWYAFTNLIIVIGLGLTAFFFMLSYACGKDSKSARARVKIAQLLIMIMWIILSIWNIVWANEFLSEKQVNLGYEYTTNNGDEEHPEPADVEHYWTMEKSTFILLNFCWGCATFAWFFYMYYEAEAYENKFEDEEEN